MSKSSPKRASTPLKLLGIALCVVAALCNHWILAAVFSQDNSLGLKSKAIIWTLQLGSLLAGLYLILASRRIEHPVEWIKNKYIYVTIQFFNLFLLFVAANVIALPFIKGPLNSAHFELYRNPLDVYFEDRELIRKVYPNRSDEDIWEITNTPSSVANPVIEYMSGPHRSKHYNVGIEGMRYDKFVNENNANELLNNSTWVFGGSTLFGAGVSDDETIVHYLNKLDLNGNKYLNFGFPSYQQNLEISKLQLLLKKGYRPKRVLFLDGWNDFTALRASTFHPAETPAKLEHAYGSVTGMDAINNPPIRSALNKLPLFKLLISLTEKPNLDKALEIANAPAYENIYRADSIYHTDPISHYVGLNQSQFDYESILENIEFYQNKVKDYYRGNADYLNDFSNGFGFEYHVFIQPFGSLSKSNPFLRSAESLEAHPYFQITSHMLESARELTGDGGMSQFHDISNADSELGHAYVDGAHYAPELCQAIAIAILESLADNAKASAQQPPAGN